MKPWADSRFGAIVAIVVVQYYTLLYLLTYYTPSENTTVIILGDFIQVKYTWAFSNPFSANQSLSMLHTGPLNALKNPVGFYVCDFILNCKTFT